MNNPEQPVEARAVENISQESSKLKWIVIISIVAMIIGGFVFYAVTRFVEVRANTRAIQQSCLIRNASLELINEKLNQLNILVAARLRDRPDGSSNPPDVIAAAEALKQPIPLISCKGL